MKKRLCWLTLFVASNSIAAFPLDSTQLTLDCPARGRVEVMLHRYEHTEELWGKGQFETGSGHTRKGPLLMLTFANLDRMVYDQRTDAFLFWYAGSKTFVKCRLLSQRNTAPVEVPYFSEKAGRQPP
ncbi:hypothetical protein [Mixta gaviniae]|uniref:Uncharacterized protein n=1 Tax=Mixta gaviniae TaxID=665914 RepID=A0A1X1E9D9_9GAMM|nr:hypothetical protein [Mixta gaviniae]AUX93540.1 hypothetical protein C2E15_10925 [Mixta gaviniae]ORM85501.1 hypothetical protein HA44_03710 [Mixta gaviniae]